MLRRRLLQIECCRAFTAKIPFLGSLFSQFLSNFFTFFQIVLFGPKCFPFFRLDTGDMPDDLAFLDKPLGESEVRNSWKLT